MNSSLVSPFLISSSITYPQWAICCIHHQRSLFSDQSYRCESVHLLCREKPFIKHRNNRSLTGSDTWYLSSMRHHRRTVLPDPVGPATIVSEWRAYPHVNHYTLTPLPVVNIHTSSFIDNCPVNTGQANRCLSKITQTLSVERSAQKQHKARNEQQAARQTLPLAF